MEKKSWTKIGEMFAKKRASRSKAYGWVDKKKLNKVSESFKKKRAEQNSN